METPEGEINAVQEAARDPALQLWLQKLREMHRPEEEIVLLDM